MCCILALTTKLLLFETRNKLGLFFIYGNSVAKFCNSAKLPIIYEPISQVELELSWK
jgi:hypothetical protein